MADRKEYTDFADVLDDIKFGEDEIEEEQETGETPLEEGETETTPETPAEDVESDADKDADESEEEPEAKPEEEEAESETKDDEAEGSEKDEDKQDEPEDKTETPITVEVDGETYTLDDIREMQRGNLRQSDYTRKTQELARQREAAAERDGLVAEIVGDEAMKAFVGAHPEIMTHLLADPDSTKALLGKPGEIQKLWDDYELVADNPRLAERFTNQAPDAAAQLEQQRIAENVQAVANALDEAVDNIAKEYEGIDGDEVKDFILKLGRVPMEEGADPNEVATAFGRLYNTFFVEDAEGGVSLDDTIIRTQFQVKSVEAAEKAKQAAEAAEEHNKEVDAQLKDEAPPTTTGGKAPAPVPEKEREYATSDEVIRDLLGHDD
jgi:hypothetical protein